MLVGNMSYKSSYLLDLPGSQQNNDFTASLISRHNSGVSDLQNIMITPTPGRERTLTMLLRSGQKENDDLFKINVDKELDLIELPKVFLQENQDIREFAKISEK